jgi:hypothetical protein
MRRNGNNRQWSQLLKSREIGNYHAINLYRPLISVKYQRVGYHACGKTAKNQLIVPTRHENYEI